MKNKHPWFMIVSAASAISCATGEDPHRDHQLPQKLSEVRQAIAHLYAQPPLAAYDLLIHQLLEQHRNLCAQKENECDDLREFLPTLCLPARSARVDMLPVVWATIVSEIKTAEESTKAFEQLNGCGKNGFYEFMAQLKLAQWSLKNGWQETYSSQMKSISLKWKEAPKDRGLDESILLASDVVLVSRQDQKASIRDAFPIFDLTLKWTQRLRGGELSATTLSAWSAAYHEVTYGNAMDDVYLARFLPNLDRLIKAGSYLSAMDVLDRACSYPKYAKLCKTQFARLKSETYGDVAAERKLQALMKKFSKL